MINTLTNDEVMYLHFINWKRSIKTCEVKYNNFYISYNKIHYNLHSSFLILLNNIKNIFNGYWVRDKRRIRNFKFNRLKNRVKKKIFNHY